MAAEILAFATVAKFRAWLVKNQDLAEGVWLRFFKKASGEKSLTYAEALDEALCQGWIDSQVKAHDEVSWIQRFTPRRARGIWSRKNTLNAERLIAAGRMKPAGWRQIEAAKADGRWQAAYDSPRTAAPPEDFVRALDQDKRAKAFFATLNRANVYAIVHRLQTAKKPATREKRLALILGMLQRGEKFHPKSRI